MDELYEIRNIIFTVFVLSLISIFGLFTQFKEPKEVSYTEQRSLSYFEGFSPTKFYTKTYQENKEVSFKDQIIYRDKFLKLYDDIHAPLVKYFYNIDNKNNKIEAIDPNFYLINNQYIINYESVNKKETYNNVKYNANLINKISDYVDDVFVYKVMNSTDYFEKYIAKEHTISDIYNNFKKSLSENVIYKEMNLSETQYLNFFYKTDHHWNNKGWRYGYEDIMKMFEEKGYDIEAKLHFGDEVSMDKVKFYGTLGKLSLYYDIYDTPNFYKIEGNMNFKGFVDGKPDSFIKGQNYIKKRYNDIFAYPHYSGINGRNKALKEIVFPDNKDKPNLLVFADSYFLPIDIVTASSFYNTYIVDLREYKEFYEKDFDLKYFIKENDIDSVLFIGYYMYRTMKFDINLDD